MNIQEFRKKKALSVKKVALHLGVTTMCIYYYETGKRKPSIETLKKLAVLFDCTIDELIN